MARFEHNRYPALTLQDADGIWARFTPEQRSFGEHVVTVGVLETDDDQLAARLRACPDKHLTEVGYTPPRTPAADSSAMPLGMSVSATQTWVGDDRARAQEALDAELAPSGQGRATLIARLEAVLAAA